MGRSKANARTVWTPRGRDEGDLILDFDDGSRRHTHHGMVIPDFRTIATNAAVKISRTNNIPRAVRSKAVYIADSWGTPSSFAAAERFVEDPSRQDSGIAPVASTLGTTAAIVYLGVDDTFTRRPVKGLGGAVWSPDRHQAIRIATEEMAGMAGSVEALINIERERI